MERRRDRAPLLLSVSASFRLRGSVALWLYRVFQFCFAGDHLAQLSEADVIADEIKQPDLERGSEGDQVIDDRDAGGEVGVETEKFQPLGRRLMESAGRTAWSRRHGTDQPKSEDENRVADRKVESEGEQCQPCRRRDQRPDTGGKKNRHRERSQIEKYRQPFGKALDEIQQRIRQFLRKPGDMPLHPLDYRRGFKSQQRENGNPD